MSNPVRAQGAEAKKLNLTEYDCPYGPGDNRDTWMSGFGAPKEAIEAEAAQPAPTEVKPEIVRKGAKKGETKAVTKGTGNAETALKTTTETADAENSDHVGAEAVIGDPGASTTRAENGGAGITTGVSQEEAENGALDGQSNAHDAGKLFD